MAKRKCKGAEDDLRTLRRSMPINGSSKSPIAVATRRQTPEEERRFDAALDLFLMEMVRQHLDPHGKS